MINLKNVRGFWVYGLLLLAFLEMSLRVGSISAFRLAIPFLFLAVVLPRFLIFKKELIFLGLLLLYNTMILVIFGGDQALFIQFFIHTLAVFSVVVLVKYLKIFDENFERRFFRFLDGFTMVTLLLFVFQYLYRFNLPGTVLGRVNTFYWTENEMGMSLAVMGCLYFQHFVFRRTKIDLLKLLAILGVLYLNDNRISLIGISFFILLSGLVSIKRHSKKALVVLALLIVLIFILNPVPNFRGSQVGIRELILEPVLRILQLEPYRLAGSLPDRTDAIIYGLMELKENYYVGIGLGNSLEVLQRPHYKLVSAQSMHNIVAQLVVELGFFAVVLYLLIFIKTVVHWWKDSTDANRIFKFAFTISFILISMQSSTGIFSNYFMVTAVSYIYLAHHPFDELPQEV